jgi:hypothetical protein
MTGPRDACHLAFELEFGAGELEQNLFAVVGLRGYNLFYAGRPRAAPHGSCP